MPVKEDICSSTANSEIFLFASRTRRNTLYCVPRLRRGEYFRISWVESGVFPFWCGSNRKKSKSCSKDEGGEKVSNLNFFTPEEINADAKDESGADEGEVIHGGGSDKGFD